VPLGYEIKAKGSWLPDGSLEAKEIQAKANIRDPKEEELVTKCNEIEALYSHAGRALRQRPDGAIVSLGELHDDGTAHKRARRILDRLLPPYIKKDEVRLYVVDNKDWNAFAMANFAIYVHSGLLADLDDDEVSIVLGHELAHATLEHTRRNMKKGKWARIAGGIAAVGGGVLTVVAGEGIGSLGGDAVRVVGGLGASALSNGFSRGFEDEADRVGLRYSYEGGFKADKAPALWRRFGEKYKDQSGVTNFLFGSHSQSKDRAKNLEGEIARNYAAGVDKPSKRSGV
jgi:predicted Zn-dependent protease